MGILLKTVQRIVKWRKARMKDGLRLKGPKMPIKPLERVIQMALALRQPLETKPPTWKSKETN